MTAGVYREQMEKELSSILQYWLAHTPDHRQGGFIGRVDEMDRPDPEAPKGLVLNSRILWTFSSAYRHACCNTTYLMMAWRAYEYLLTFFWDVENGGAFWSVEASGHPLNDRKQIYGQAFLLYGLSEFYRASGEAGVLREAIALFRLIEQHSFDHCRKGYYEAFTRDWQQPEDLRLSEKDANEQKTMNTHLHVLEAYTNLYRGWPDELLRQRILDLLTVFDRYIIDKTSGHLGLFFNQDWAPRSTLVSYGHDIEAAWLLAEAAEVVNDSSWIARTHALALQLANAAAEGLDTRGGFDSRGGPDSRGGLWYEKEADRLIREKHWWPQAEAMVGFLHAWQISGEEIWWQRSVETWNFVRQYIRAPAMPSSVGNEWHWGVLADDSPMPGQDKAGFWKCPYHNSRACLEIIRRLTPAV
jgi:mannobiose 2-epimerase